MPDELAAFGNRLERVVGPDAMRHMMNAAGGAGKAAALRMAARDLGSDRAMSGLRGGRVRLNAGYDITGTAVDINMRPAGAWALASTGRRGTKPIVPKRRSGKRAVLTPQGPRARSTSKPSRGLHTYADTVKHAQREVPEAAFRAFRAEIAIAMRAGAGVGR